MARLTFRQGILRHAQDSLGNQTFLDVVGNYVKLVAQDEPTIVAFAHGTTDYIFTETSDVEQAWGPLNAGTPYWLYWELDKKTGARTFGASTSALITQAQMPKNPVVGQMWFNTNQNRMYDYTPNGWVEVIRVLAARIDQGMVPHSVSKNAPKFTGTQVGLTDPTRAGGIVYDMNGYPIKKEDKTFFTTEDDFMTGLPSGAQLRISNITLSAVAAMPLARHQVVEYSGYGRLAAATPFNQSEKLLGIVEYDVITGEDVYFSVEGMFFNDDWSWQTAGATAGDPIYINETGEIGLNPVIPGQFPVGIVVGPQEIMFAPAMMAKGATDSISLGFEDLNNTPSSLSGHANHLVRVNSAGTALEFVQDLSGGDGTNWGEITGLIQNQGDLQTALNERALVGHTHGVADIADFTHTHTLADITDFGTVSFATAEQGLLADSALQPGANISTLINDVNYINSESDPVFLGQKGQPNGVATLDGAGKIPQSQIPAIAVNNTFVVNNQTSMINLPAQTGDLAIRTDLNKTFILQGTEPLNIGEWTELLSSIEVPVTSVDGRTGNVTLSDLYASATHTHPATLLQDETAPTLSATLNANNNVLTNVEISRYFETVTSPTVAANTVLDFSTATVFALSLTTNTTLSITNPPPVGKAGSYTLVITQDSTGGRTVTGPASFTRGTMDIATGPNEQTIITLLTVDGGTTYTVMTAFKEGV